MSRLQPLCPSDLCHTAQIQTRSIAVDAAGDDTVSWATTARRRVSIEPLRGRELIQGDADTAAVTHRIRMRYDAGLGLTPDQHRLLIGDRVFGIEYVINLKERNLEYEILAIENPTEAAS